MKRLIFLCMCGILLGAVHMQAQTLHAIIFANTKSPGDPNKPGSVGIGPSVTVDFERMGVEMTTIASFIGYKLQKYYYYDTPDRFSRSSLMNVLNNLSCGSQDIVFFYYSGHGLRAMNEETKFPEMVLKVPHGAASTSDLYPLHDVYKRIKAKSPRLTLVFGDLCNKEDESYYRSPDSPINKGASVRSTSACDIYRDLFLGVKGGLIVSSSKPGEYSGCAEDADGEDLGGIFTNSFLTCLQSAVRSGSSIAWTKLLDQSIQLSQKVGDGQTPVYTSELIAAAMPSTQASTSTPAPQQVPQSNDEQTNLQDKIAGALTVIANKRTPLTDRIRKIAPTLSSYFATQARVQVVGRDSKTIVNTSSASNYLNYLSMATNMDQVMVLEMKKNAQGKVSYLKVHEMRTE